MEATFTSQAERQKKTQRANETGRERQENCNTQTDRETGILYLQFRVSTEGKKFVEMLFNSSENVHKFDETQAPEADVQWVLGGGFFAPLESIQSPL